MDGGEVLASSPTLAAFLITLLKANRGLGWKAVLAQAGSSKGMRIGPRNPASFVLIGVNGHPLPVLVISCSSKEKLDYSSNLSRRNVKPN